VERKGERKNEALFFRREMRIRNVKKREEKTAGFPHRRGKRERGVSIPIRDESEAAIERE